MRSTLSRFGDSPSTSRSWPCVRMRTLKSDSRCLRFSSYEPNKVSIPSSGTVILRIPWPVISLLHRYLAEPSLYRASIDDAQVQFPQLFSVHRRGRLGHEVDGIGGFR